MVSLKLWGLLYSFEAPLHFRDPAPVVPPYWLHIIEVDVSMPQEYAMASVLLIAWTAVTKRIAVSVHEYMILC